MKTKKSLLTSCLVIALCLSLICGATFAMFTDSASTNIVVSGGKVEIDATIIKDSLTLYSLDEDTQEIVEQEDGFVTGGTATLTGNSLSLEKIVPGDGVELTLSVKNNSTVSIKYAIIVAVNNTVVNGTYKLSDALVATVDGEPVADGVSEWKSLAGSEQFPSDTMTIAVSLPVSTGNEYQGLACSIDIILYAIQSNADTSGIKLAYSQEQFEDALANAEEGDTIEVGKGTFELPSSISTDGITISGTEGTVVEIGSLSSVMTTISGNNVTLKGMDFKTVVGSSNQTAELAISGDNVTVDGCTFNSSGTNYTAIKINSGAESVTIKDCNFVGGFRQIGNSYGTADTTITIVGCTFSGGTYGVHFDQMNGSTVVIRDCTISAWSSFGGIGGGKVIVENTTFADGGAYNSLRPYVDTELINCTFGSKFWFDAGKADIKITFIAPTLPAGIGSVADLIEKSAKFAFHYVVDGAEYEYTPA